MSKTYEEPAGAVLTVAATFGQQETSAPGINVDLGNLGQAFGHLSSKRSDPRAAFRGGHFCQLVGEVAADDAMIDWSIGAENDAPFPAGRAHADNQHFVASVLADHPIANCK